ncbi:MAG: undecaprenyl-diphosphate phosphatase [Cyclobacteriaceae bacterium]|jgi:undecaprenyl-diphosphatase
MGYFEAIVLAVVEGLTEFLPVSSTGHMIIASSAMGIASDPFTKMFTIAIQLGAILSVVVLYWKRFFKDIHFYLKLALAFLPAGVFGFLLNDYIDSLLERVDVVGWALIVGGIFFLFVDRLFQRNETEGLTTVSYPSAVKIGFFQVLAIVAPGVSRAAATIIGGLAVKLNRQTAAEFSFFLAVPTMAAATGYKLLRFLLDGHQFGAHELALLSLGNVVAFVVAMIAIRTFISYLSRNGFKIFGYYRIGVGALILTLYYLGVQLEMV